MFLPLCLLIYFWQGRTRRPDLSAFLVSRLKVAWQMHGYLKQFPARVWRGDKGL